MANQHTYSPPFTETELSEAYQAGKTQEEIADQFNTTQKVVWLAMKKWNIKARVAAKRDQRGDKNASWKGDQAKYGACHTRVEVVRGKPQKCEECGTTDPNKHYDWASLTKNYHDVNDYKRLCRSCHAKLDNSIKNITGSIVPQIAQYIGERILEVA